MGKQRFTINGVDFGPREFELAKLVSESYPHKQIAARMGITMGTVKEYLVRIYIKMRCAHPEIANSDMRLVLASWVRCYLCKDKDPRGEGI